MYTVSFAFMYSFPVPDFLPLILLPPLFLLIHYTLHQAAISSIPGPWLISSLSPGPVRRLLTDPRTFTDCMDHLGRTYGDTFAVWLGFSRVVVTSVPADIVHITSSPALFPRPEKIRNVFKLASPGGLFTMPAEKHRIVRRRLRDSFNHKMLHSFHQAMINAVRQLCKELESAAASGKPVDISKPFAMATFMVITNVAFGSDMPLEERVAFADVVNCFTEEMMYEYMGSPFRKAFAWFGTRKRFYKARNRVYELCNKFIERRKQETTKEKEERKTDMLDAIIALEDQSAEAMTSIVVEFALTGSHSINQMLSWCIYEICGAQKAADSIEKELKERVGDRPLGEYLAMEDVESLQYIKSVWKETCRLHPSGSSTSRVAAKNVTLKGSGVHVSKGTEIHGQVRRSQRKAPIWKRGEQFVPERWISGPEGPGVERVPAGAFNPFSLGQMNCAGRFLANYEGPLLLAEIFRRFRVRLACDRKAVQNRTLFIDTPKFVSSEGRETGIPVLVDLRYSH